MKNCGQKILTEDRKPIGHLFLFMRNKRKPLFYKKIIKKTKMLKINNKKQKIKNKRNKK